MFTAYLHGTSSLNQVPSTPRGGLGAARCHGSSADTGSNASVVAMSVASRPCAVSESWSWYLIVSTVRYVLQGTIDSGG